MKKNGVGLFLVLFGVLFLGIVSGVEQNGQPAAAGSIGPLVEVHGPDIAFVPSTAKYVTYDGVVHKIARLVPVAAGPIPERCDCPNCCDNRCYILIYSGLGGGKVGALSLYYLWIEC